VLCGGSFKKKRTPSTSDEALEEAGGHQFPPPSASAPGAVCRVPRDVVERLGTLGALLARTFDNRCGVVYSLAGTLPPPLPPPGGGWVGESGDTAGEKDGDAMVRAPPRTHPHSGGRVGRSIPRG